MYDLHLHSTCSDGDLAPADVMARAHETGLAGVSLTDHNGVWGTVEAAAAARAAGLDFIAGIEVTTLFQGCDVHLLGYSRAFDTARLEAGLSATRAGYQDRIHEMVQRCQAAGYTKLSLAEIEAGRQGQEQPCLVSYDVARQLNAKHGVSIDEARMLTVRGGACYVPYGEWALTPRAATKLLHHAGGVVVLAHPGTVLAENGEEGLAAILEEVTGAGIDGVEVFHPFHRPELIDRLQQFATERGLLITGGSDWHGPGRFHDAELGKVGLSSNHFSALLARL